VYLTLHHYKINILNPQQASFCSFNEVIDCDGIASSEYSTFLNIPVSTFGMFAYAFLFLMLIYDGKKNHYLALVYLFAIVMMAFSLWEMFASYVILKKICILCTLLYVMTITLVIMLKQFQKASHKTIFLNAFASIKAFFPLKSNLAKILEIASIPAVALVFAIFLDRCFYGQYQDLKNGQKYLFNKGSGDSVNVTALYNSISPLFLQIDGSPFKGPKSAPVEIVMFGDFQCAGCLTMGENLKELYAEKGNKVKIVYKFFPLDNKCNRLVPRPMHLEACIAAYYAYCSHRQNKFWEMFDLLEDNSSNLSPGVMNSWLVSLNLNTDDFKECVAKEGVDFVKRDVDQGIDLDIGVTPTVFINGRNVTSILNSKADLWSIVEYLLEK
jgi:uncharacterized membrane protein/protein-disulfide isomerase